MNKKIVFSLVIVGLLIFGIFAATNLTQTRKILSSFAQTPTTSNSNGDASVDLNGDGQVNIFDFNNVVSNFGRRFDPVAGVVNVKAYGAKGDGVVDDTAAIQKAIDSAKDSSSQHRIFFPQGWYKVSSLNITNSYTIRLEGETMNGAKLIASSQTTSQPVLDLTGSMNVEIESLTITTSIDLTPGHTPPAVLPTVGILIASAQNSNSTNVHLKNVSVNGHFSKAALYLFGSCCDGFDNSHFVSYKNGAPAAVITGVNYLGVTSPFTTIATADASGLTLDQTFVESEFHDLSNLYDTVQGQTNTVQINNSTSVKFYGGVFSTCGPSIVNLQSTNREITFDGTLFAQNEEDSKCRPAQQAFFAQGPVNGLALRNVAFNGGLDPNGAVISGSSAAALNGLTLEGFLKGDPRFKPTTRLIRLQNTANPAEVRIQGSSIMAAGLAIEPGGSISSSLIFTPGAIVLPPGATDTSQKLN